MIKLTSNLLKVDTRESLPTKRVWRLLEEDYKDLSVEICCLKVADYENDFMLLEFKTIGDFVSSFTEVIIRKDGTRYHRLESQIDRMLKSDKPYKYLLIYGNIADLHSNIHPNSVRGQIASIMAKGISVLWLPKGENYFDQIYRLHKKSIKYGKIKGEFKIPNTSKEGLKVDGSIDSIV